MRQKLGHRERFGDQFGAQNRFKTEPKTSISATLTGGVNVAEINVAEMAN